MIEILFNVFLVIVIIGAIIAFCATGLYLLFRLTGWYIKFKRRSKMKSNREKFEEATKMSSTYLQWSSEYRGYIVTHEDLIAIIRRICNDDMVVTDKDEARYE